MNFSFFALAGLVPILASIVWFSRRLPADRRARARVQAGIAIGVLVVVLGISFAQIAPPITEAAKSVRRVIGWL
jgi:hypothetical protein